MTNQIATGIEDIGAILRTLNNWLVLIAVIALTLFGVGFVLVGMLPTAYSSTALLIIDSDRRPTLRDDGPSLSDPFRVRGEIAILASDSVAARVVREMDLASHPAFQDALTVETGGARAAPPEEAADGPDALSPETMRRVINAYSENVNIFNDGRSPVISITVTAPDPVLASDLANAHVAAYFAHKGETSATSYQSILAQVEASLRHSADRLRETSLEMESLRNESGLVLGIAGEENTSLLDSELPLVTNRLEEARSEAALVRSTLKALEAQEDFESLLAFAPLQTPAMEVLREREAEAQIGLLRLEAIFDAGDPSLRQAELDLAAVRQAMAQEIARVRAGLHTDAERVDDKIAVLERRLSALVEARKTQNLAQAKISALQAEVDSRRTFHQALQRENQIVLFESGFLGAGAKLVSDAVPPLAPSFPATKLLLALALIVSLVVAATVALLAEWLVGRSRSLQELEALTGLEGIGEVPFATRDDERVFRLARVWQPLRAVRARLTHGWTEPCLVVGLTATSADPRVARLAVGLAKSVAATTTPALVVDADVADPSITKVLRVKRASWPGLVDVLDGTMEAESAVVNGGQPHFDVLAAGGGKNPAGMDLLATDRFGALIDALRDSYRVIIVLAAPVDRFADALSVLRHADRTVIAVPAGRGSLRELEDAIDLLAPARIGPEGFVLLQPRSRFAMSRRSRQKGAQGLTQPVTKLRHAASTPR